MILKKNIYLSFFTLISSVLVVAEPWYDIDSLDIVYEYNEASFQCDEPIHKKSFSPMPLSEIYLFLDRVNKKKDLTDSCKNNISILENLLKKQFYKDKKLIGYQSGINSIYLQERGDRNYIKENIFYSYEKVINNFSYKIKLTKNNEASYIDNTHFSYLFNNNHVFYIGRTNRWWSPSNDSSLILSNSSRPYRSVGLKSFMPIKLNWPIFKHFENFDYEIFLGKLERERVIPNALILGSRISFYPHERFNFSLLRTAQFSGKNRPINSQVIKNLITGKDTTNSDLSFFDQAGNQLAGVDFSIRLMSKSNLELYGQYIGEDGLDPIIDDDIFGAIFPSKRFALGGLRYNLINLNTNWTFTLEHINTDSGHKNITYNHSLYKTGYRYKSNPIGASIDADSHKSFISLQRVSKRGLIKLKYQDMHLNQNGSEFTRFGQSEVHNKEFIFKLSRYINNNLRIELNFIKRDSNSELFKDIFFIKIEQQL